MQSNKEQQQQIDERQIVERRPDEASHQPQNLFKDRFKFHEQVNEGCFGKVYDVTDLQEQENSPLILKIQGSDYQYRRELEFLQLHTEHFYNEYQGELNLARQQGKESYQTLKKKLLRDIDFPLLASFGEQMQTEWIYVGKLDQFDESQQEALNIDSEFMVKYPKSRKEKDDANAEAPNERDMQKKGKVFQRIEKVKYCLIMNKFGDSLREINDLFSNKFTIQTILQIGIQLVTALERIHSYGYVYNDLKPDNILVGDKSLLAQIDGRLPSTSNMDEMNLHKLRLIDFGLVTRYMDDNGQHIADGIEDKFKGSMLFASKNSFNFVSTSRRDDFISLVYILVFFLDMGRLKFINRVQNKSKHNKFRIIKELKLAMGPQELCGTREEESQAHCLLEFTEEIFALDFASQPDYGKLRFILSKELLSQGIKPGRNYDWTLQAQKQKEQDGSRQLRSRQKRRDDEQISNESGNNSLFDHICLDAEKASMQAVANSIYPSAQLHNQAFFLGTIKENEQVGANNRAQAPQQILRRQDEPGGMNKNQKEQEIIEKKRQQAKNSNRQMNKSANSSCSISSNVVCEINGSQVDQSIQRIPGYGQILGNQQPSHLNQQNYQKNLIPNTILNQDNQQLRNQNNQPRKMMPQIQAIINSESNMGVIASGASGCGGSVQMSGSNNNSTAQQNNFIPQVIQPPSAAPLQNEENQPLNINQNQSFVDDGNSINSMMNQYMFQPKSNHKFMNDNKGVLMLAGQPQLNQLQQPQAILDRQFPLVPSVQQMQQQQQPQFLVQQINNHCVLQQPLSLQQIQEQQQHIGNSAAIMQVQNQQSQQQQMGQMPIYLPMNSEQQLLPPQVGGQNNHQIQEHLPQSLNVIPQNPQQSQSSQQPIQLCFMVGPQQQPIQSQPQPVAANGLPAPQTFQQQQQQIAGVASGQQQQQQQQQLNQIFLPAQSANQQLSVVNQQQQNVYFSQLQQQQQLNVPQFASQSSQWPLLSVANGQRDQSMASVQDGSQLAQINENVNANVAAMQSKQLGQQLQGLQMQNLLQNNGGNMEQSFQNQLQQNVGQMLYQPSNQRQNNVIFPQSMLVQGPIQLQQSVLQQMSHGQQSLNDYSDVLGQSHMLPMHYPSMHQQFHQNANMAAINVNNLHQNNINNNQIFQHPLQIPQQSMPQNSGAHKNQNKNMHEQQ